MNWTLRMVFSLAELSFLYLLAFYTYKFASGKMLIPEDKKQVYQLWVSRNGNSLKRAILVLVVLLSTAILSQLIFY